MATAVRPARVQHVCADCGAGTPKWQGRCPACGAWNSLLEGTVPPPAPRSARSSPAGAGAVRSLESLASIPVARRVTRIGEWDRVLGGGFVPGALVLLGGDPGIGKSTLALQVAQRVGRREAPALYCAGEESPQQLALRAGRVGCSGPEVCVLAETDLDIILATIEAHRPPLAVIDSVQTTLDSAMPGAAGSVSQVRAAVNRVMGAAKASGVPVLLVGHVTKDGAIAGPRTLEHMVDVVLYLEGERHGEHRLLRGVKNRFGATDELGVFAMAEHGLAEVAAPGRAFLDEGSLGIAGNVLTITCEGARPLAVEVQALTATSALPLPRRTASGFDVARLHVLLAVLERRAATALTQRDVYVNAVGGVHLAEPAADLAVLLAIAGAAGSRSLGEGCVALGEVGLGGEVRRVRRLDQRLGEALALGVERAVIPAVHAGALPSGLRYQRVATVAEAVRLLA